MSNTAHSIANDEPLSIVRSLAFRRHVERLHALEREVISLLYGVGCGRLDPAEVAERLEIDRTHVAQLRDRALRELGMQVMLEAAA
jgi:DNA-directed RNA polymerase specialized sigma24 family protein